MSHTSPAPESGSPVGGGGGATQVIGDYLIGEVVGKGSFGKVKKGIHMPTGESVAIKILNRAKLKNANMDKKIRREIKILKLFRHTNITRLYEVIPTPTDIFLIMEFVEGGELYDHIVECGRLKEDHARYVFQQIVCALEYGHHFRVVHRDLKPENVLLGSNLHIKMIDFGLANIMRDGEFLATSCGSPNYAAPEVISGKLYAGPEVDVWSCGVVLYALLCGCLPFDEETIPLLFAKIKRGRYTVPSHVSREAKDLLDQLLVVDPLARLTIPQIRDNAWFNKNLPPHLLYQESSFNHSENISDTMVRKAMACTHLPEDVVREQIRIGEGAGYVAYSISLDAKKRTEIASIGARIQGTGLSPTAPHLTATQRELNMGLVLAGSPAMNCLIDVNDASLNKRSYNTSMFLPNSVHEAKGPAAETPGRISAQQMMQPYGNQQQQQQQQPHSQSFGFLTANNGGMSTAGSGSLLSSSLTHTANSLRGGGGFGSSGMSLSNTTNAGAAGGAGGGDRIHTGSVAKTSHLFTPEEEAFILSNNFGWRLGIMTDQKSNLVMATIYGELTQMGMEWKTAAPFKLLLRYRQVPAVTQSVVARELVLHLHVMRLQEKHDRGYLIDFSIVRGSTIFALDVIAELRARLTSRIG